MSELVLLDVRSVEPRDRFDRIMGAYEALGAEQTLELTVDHDPKCMYYTLRATRGDDAFDFDYLENGPETWRVQVRKAAAGARA
ncbi:MAG TPA: DUF2249 domain-containing protein [Gemmatimonadales bacterium]|nr:DUF2249 domain-containing protein [Gemmatimonadales bacterium]